MVIDRVKAAGAGAEEKRPGAAPVRQESVDEARGGTLIKYVLGWIGFCLLGQLLPPALFAVGFIVMVLWGIYLLVGPGGPFEGPYQRS